jgi:hypothetical protein
MNPTNQASGLLHVLPDMPLSAQEVTGVWEREGALAPTLRPFFTGAVGAAASDPIALVTQSCSTYEQRTSTAQDWNAPLYSHAMRGLLESANLRDAGALCALFKSLYLVAHEDAKGFLRIGLHFALGEAYPEAEDRSSRVSRVLHHVVNGFTPQIRADIDALIERHEANGLVPALLPSSGDVDDSLLVLLPKGTAHKAGLDGLAASVRQIRERANRQTNNGQDGNYWACFVQGLASTGIKASVEIRALPVLRTVNWDADLDFDQPGMRP